MRDDKERGGTDATGPWYTFLLDSCCMEACCWWPLLAIAAVIAAIVRAF